MHGKASQSALRRFWGLSAALGLRFKESALLDVRRALRQVGVGRVVAVVEWIAARKCLAGLDQIGKRRSVGFWKAHRDLANSTAYTYWLALRELYR